MFGGIPISVTLVLKSESTSTTGVFQWRRTIDEKHSMIDVGFLEELREK